MQRLITGWSHADAASAGQFQGYSTRSSWPYSPTQTTSSTQPSSSSSSHPGQQAASSSRVAATRARSGGLAHSVEQLLHHIRHMQGFRDIWEVAVKRNGMTTSLALLGGVLVADMLLYRPKQRQTMIQANLAAPNSSSAQQHPDVAHSSSSSSSSSSTHGEVVAPRLTPPGVMPAHA